MAHNVVILGAINSIIEILNYTKYNIDKAFVACPIDWTIGLSINYLPTNISYKIDEYKSTSYVIYGIITLIIQG